MRAFRYRLATVLKRAQHAEQILQIELARLQDHLADAIQRLRTLRRLRDDFHTRLRHLQSGGPPALLSQPAHPRQVGAVRPTFAVDLDRVVSLRRQLEQLDKALDRAALLRRELEETIAAARARLLDAARSRQTFENHRDGQARTHHRGELAAQTKHLDELANARFAARMAPGHASNHAPHPRSEESNR